MFYNVQNGEFKIGTFKNKLSPQKLGHFTDLIFSKDSSDCLSEKIFADKHLNVR